LAHNVPQDLLQQQVTGTLELEDAQRRILKAVVPLGVERCPLTHAAGRVAAEPVRSPFHLPVFDNSAMDGYAVRTRDLTRARPAQSVALRIAGRVGAGGVFPGTVPGGGCVRVFTGSPLPSGTDAVVPQENARIDAGSPERVSFSAPIERWACVRRRGEDLKPGARLLESGARLTASHLALLAAVGLTDVLVHRRPLLGLVATGSELQTGGQPLEPGRVYESNRIELSALTTQAGALPHVYPLVPDTLSATINALEQAFDECDAVATSGGISVGEFDFVKRAFAELGGGLEFWQVAIKPGKPFAFGRRAGKLLFGLPGNPVSALVTFVLLVRPALNRLEGAAQFRPPTCLGVLQEALENRGERRHFVRVVVDEQGNVRSAGAQGSHILSSLAPANGLVDVPPGTTLPARTGVKVIRWS
jgi:molybdopterin molybdotransferase